MMERERGEGVGASPDRKHGHGPNLSGRQIGAIVLLVVLVVFIAVNRQEAPVDLVFTTVELPMWLTLTITAVLGALVGAGWHARRVRKVAKRS